jgi:hypothetical protein
MRIGFDVIAGEAEICLMAIGLQPIGNVVVRNLATGMFESLTRAMGFGRRVIGAYLDEEPVELESRPNPRPAAALAARLVVAVALLVVTATAPGATLLSMIGAAALLAGARFGRWAVVYLRREFISQWRVLACTGGPAIAFLAWVAYRVATR